MMANRPAAYEKLIFYRDICEIRRLVCRITDRFPKSHIRLVSQMRAAARSAKQNIREFYRRGSLGEFIQGIHISQGSLAELSGDVDDCREDSLITAEEFRELSSLLRRADFMMGRFIHALYRLEKAGGWKTPGRRGDRLPARR